MAVYVSSTYTTDTIKQLCLKTFLSKRLWHAYTKTTYQNQWSYRKQATKNGVKDEHTKNCASPKNSDLSYGRRCRKKIRKNLNHVFLVAWWRYTLNRIPFLTGSKSMGPPNFRWMIPIVKVKIMIMVGVFLL